MSRIDPEDIWADPTLGHIRTFAQARLTSPWATLGTVLMRSLATVPADITLPPIVGGLGSLNLFLAVVGDSGMGKGASVAAARDAVHLPIDAPHLPVGSGEGLVKAYAHRERMETATGDKEWQTVQDRQSIVFDVSEVDQLAALSGRTGSTLMNQLRSAYSGELLGSSYADPEKAVTLEPHSYRLALIVGVQPRRSGAILSESDGGTPQRFVWMPAADPLVPTTSPAEPESLTVAPVRWSPGQKVMKVPAAAENAIRENRQAALRGERPPLDGHALFTRLKVAAALAVLDGRGHLNLRDWDLSALIMAKSDETRQVCVDAVAQVEEEEAAKRGASRAVADLGYQAKRVDLHHKNVVRVGNLLLKYLVQAMDSGGTGLRVAEMNRKLRSSDRGYLREALELLTIHDQVATLGYGDDVTFEPVTMRAAA
jgi:hypothetical protein